MSAARAEAGMSAIRAGAVAASPPARAREAREGLLARAPAWLLAVGLLVGCAGLGAVAGAPARPIFILGCVYIGYRGWRQGVGPHFTASLILLCFAPFVRRVVDLTAGFDEAGFMLVGPMLAIALPGYELLVPARGRPHARWLVLPMIVIGLCTVYASALSLFQGDFKQAASGMLKNLSPLFYGAALLRRPEAPRAVVQAAASAFLWILPVLGLYGVWQYIDPPEWDRFWMKSATILSAGYPEPFQVRTFSMMHSPGSFATFCGVGLVLVLFLRTGPLALLAISPALAAFLLSMYRTAWIGVVFAILYCLLFSATRRKAALAIGSGVVAVLAALATPLGDVLTDRLKSFTEGSNDGSARERLDQFVSLWTRPGSHAFGSGYSAVDVGNAGTMAIDGAFVANWVAMGLFVGLVCVIALFAASLYPALQPMRARADRSAVAVAIGALAVYMTLQHPLASVQGGESGFLFWAFMLLARGGEPEGRNGRS